jgi:uncharacterized protein Smg (DUF494 family)
MKEIINYLESHSEVRAKYATLIGSYRGILSFLIEANALQEPILEIIVQKMKELDKEFDKATKIIKEQ